MFDALGGFPQQPFLEDLDLVKHARSRGRVSAIESYRHFMILLIAAYVQILFAGDHSTAARRLVLETMADTRCGGQHLS